MVIKAHVADQPIDEVRRDAAGKAAPDDSVAGRAPSVAAGSGGFQMPVDVKLKLGSKRLRVGRKTGKGQQEADANQREKMARKDGNAWLHSNELNGHCAAGVRNKTPCR